VQTKAIALANCNKGSRTFHVKITDVSPRKNMDWHATLVSSRFDNEDERGSFRRVDGGGNHDYEVDLNRGRGRFRVRVERTR
jgi:hypothetical protein